MMRRLLPGAIILAVAAFAAAPSFAQSSFPTQQPNVNAPGVVDMCVGSDNVARPCGALTPQSVQIIGGIPSPAYPTNAVPITGNATGSTSAVVGTLAAARFKTTYICGFDIESIGGTAAVGPVTVAGLVGSSMVFQGSSSAAGGSVAKQTFSPCVPASGTNTAITITTTANGTATAVDVNAWGFQL